MSNEPKIDLVQALAEQEFESYVWSEASDKETLVRNAFLAGFRAALNERSDDYAEGYHDAPAFDVSRIEHAIERAARTIAAAMMLPHVGGDAYERDSRMHIALSDAREMWMDTEQKGPDDGNVF